MNVHNAFFDDTSNFYIKLIGTQILDNDEEMNAVNLATGERAFFADTDIVGQVNAKVAIDVFCEE